MLKSGDSFGDYRVIKLLGRGGMGSVFLLENAAGGQVAAKILDPETASDHEARKRFLREAQLALGVKHPNLVKTYDVWRGALSVAKYMACTAYDELQRKGYSLEADLGASAFVRFARMLDPGFSRYDAEGNPKTGGTPELKYVDKKKYASGRFFAMLEDLHQRKPDLFVRYRQVMLRRNGGNPSYEAVIEDLCTAYGGDWPRRWPAAEDAASVKNPAKESRGN